MRSPGKRYRFNSHMTVTSKSCKLAESVASTTIYKHALDGPTHRLSASTLEVSYHLPLKMVDSSKRHSRLSNKYSASKNLTSTKPMLMLKSNRPMCGKPAPALCLNDCNRLLSAKVGPRTDLCATMFEAFVMHIDPFLLANDYVVLRNNHVQR